VIVIQEVFNPMKSLLLLSAVALAGGASAQTIDLSQSHSAPLPDAMTAERNVATTRVPQHALAPKLTRILALHGPDGRLQAVCSVERNPALAALKLQRGTGRAAQEPR
jgi:hypothetical protein